MNTLERLFELHLVLFGFLYKFLFYFEVSCLVCQTLALLSFFVWFPDSVIVCTCPGESHLCSIITSSFVSPVCVCMFTSAQFSVVHFTCFVPAFSLVLEFCWPGDFSPLTTVTVSLLSCSVCFVQHHCDHYSKACISLRSENVKV